MSDIEKLYRLSSDLRNAIHAHPKNTEEAERDFVLCRESEDWDWWLKLPPEVKGASVALLRELIRQKVGEQLKAA